MLVSEFLKSVGPANQLTDIKRLVADLKEAVEAEGVEDSGTDPVELAGTIQELENSVAQLSEYLVKIQTTMDKQYLPIFKATADANVTSYTTAYNATLFYDKYFFSRLFLSNEGKQELAEYLLGVISPFCKVNLETLSLIKEREPDMLMFCSYPRSED